MLRNQFFTAIRQAVSAVSSEGFPHQQIRELATRRRVTVLRRAAKKAAGTKREGHYEYSAPPVKTWSIFKGDLVEVVSGKETGKQAKVTRVDRMYGTLYLEGLRVDGGVTKRASSLHQPRFTTVQFPFLYNHVRLVNPETKQACLVRWKVLENGDRVRYAKDTGTLIPRPTPQIRTKTRSPSPLETAREDAKRVTYDRHPNYLKAEQKKPDSAV